MKEEHKSKGRVAKDKRLLWLQLVFINAKVITEDNNRTTGVPLTLTNRPLQPNSHHFRNPWDDLSPKYQEIRDENPKAKLYVWVRSLCKPPPQQCNHSHFCWFTCLPFPMLFPALFWLSWEKTATICPQIWQKSHFVNSYQWFKTGNRKVLNRSWHCIVLKHKLNFNVQNVLSLVHQTEPNKGVKLFKK